MIRIFGRGARDGASLSDNRGGPWGPGGGDDDGAGGEGGPRNPWGPRRRKPPPGGSGGGGPGPFDELLRKGRERFGGGFPSDGRPYWLYGLGVILVLWILFTYALSLYVAHSGSFGSTYGPLTGVMALLLWAYLTSIALLDRKSVV